MELAEGGPDRARTGHHDGVVTGAGIEADNTIPAQNSDAAAVADN